jgi:predicted  nucleic acid-binding Zn-ribbon protein
MSVEFSNTYQEILLDNFNSVIKQNLMFQTQLKMAEEAQKNNKSDEKINLLNGEYNVLKSDYDNALKKISDLEVRASVGQSLHDEKTRVQAALNDELKKAASLNTKILEQTKIIDEQTLKINEQSKTIEDITKQLEKSNAEIEDLKSTLEKKESMPTEIETILPKVKKTNSKVVNNIPDGSSF